MFTLNRISGVPFYDEHLKKKADSNLSFFPGYRCIVVGGWSNPYSVHVGNYLNPHIYPTIFSATIVAPNQQNKLLIFQFSIS